MAKVIETRDGWMVRCRACQWHEFPKNRSWTFNGNVDEPTFSPSLNQATNLKEWKDHNPLAPSGRCHFIVTSGKIQYCGDCTHNLANTTHSLEEWDAAKVHFYEALKKEEGW